MEYEASTLSAKTLSEKKKLQRNGHCEDACGSAPRVLSKRPVGSRNREDKERIASHVLSQARVRHSQGWE
jgi:hypothetical protein